ncbi:carbohydrate ABC transporter permease [Microbacterium sp. CFH 31415]|uniref:carbohydrate ABC transporter permease n=1 Tax=Microbacterium sp. CFH 31415 TaxID=2921732 RepID=UPI001F12AB53|nr:carbohydrate ABC transporter permease [Microbacterium sp. CFH 31415]MCH6231467.1 carbohydrate ABC transporter permease [Microbacterium sp. CFH 31415]
MTRSARIEVAVVVAAAIVCWLPIWFMLVVASRDSASATTFPPPLLPGGSLVDNVGTVLAAVSFGRALVNSVIVAGCVALGGALVCALAGFAFAKLSFPGRRPLFMLVMLGLTLPVQLAVIPQYLLVSAFGWVDSLTALIVPALASAFGVFWMRQYIVATLPDELLDAAALDGCGTVRTFRHVAWPLVRPGAAVLAGILFVTTWCDFMWPFIVLRSPRGQTVQVALRALQGEYGADYALVFTGALLATAPMILMLVVAGRRITRDGIARAPAITRR